MSKTIAHMSDYDYYVDTSTTVLVHNPGSASYYPENGEIASGPVVGLLIIRLT